jgi:hypothetical protein
VLIVQLQPACSGLFGCASATYAAALPAFWSGAIYLGRGGGALDLLFCFISELCVAAVQVFTYVAGSSIYRISMIPAALLAC